MSKFKAALLAVSLTFILFACSKSDDTIPAPTPTPCPTPLTKLEIITKKTWQMDEIHRTVSGVYGKYIRGGVNTTGANYDAWRLTFNTNGTGTNIYTNGISYPITWSFSSPDQHNMIVTSNGQTLNFNLVEINETYFHATSPVPLGGGAYVLESFRLTQVP